MWPNLLIHFDNYSVDSFHNFFYFAYERKATRPSPYCFLTDGKVAVGLVIVSC